MKNLALKTVRYFDPSNDDHPINEHDEKIALLLIGFSTTIIQSIYTYLLGLKVDALILAIFTSFGLFILFFYKHKKINYTLNFHLQTFLICLCLIAVNIDAGMISSPSMIWLGTLPIFAIVYIGLFWGFIWSIFSILLSMFIHYLYQAHLITFNEFTLKHATEISFSNLLTGPLLFYFCFGYYFNRKQEEHNINKPLIEMGKSTSFLLHEISKPISRIKNAPTQEDIEQVVNIFTLANSINSNQSLIIKSKIDFKILLDEIISEYNEFIDYYNISIKIPNNHAFIHTNRELITIVIKNLIKNSIENNIQYKLETPIAIDFSKDFFKISNSLLDENIQEEEILKPGYTSKNGNMGMGMMIVTGVLKNLNHKFKTEIDRKSKTISFAIIF